MRYGVWILLALCVLSLATGCGGSDGTVTALPTQMLQPADSPVPTATPHTVTIDPTPVCPPARGIGTVSPAVSISSITFLVNGLEQVVYGDDMLQAAPGDRVQVTDAIICAGTFSGKGGEACVDFAPVDQSGQEIFPEHKGTHLVPVAPGLIVISDLDVAWTISEDWSGISAVLNHWTPENTQDLGCASERCERDDRIMVELHSPAAISFVLSLVKWYRAMSHKVVPVRVLASVISRHADGEKGKASWYAGQAIKGLSSPMRSDFVSP